MFFGIITNLISSLIEGTGNFLFQELTNNVQWKVWKKELFNLTSSQNDFIDRYAEALVSLKKAEKPNALLHFFGDESAIELIRKRWYGEINMESFEKEFDALTQWFTLEKQIEGFSPEQARNSFLRFFKEAVHQNRSAGQAELIHKIEEIDRNTSKKIFKNSAEDVHYRNRLASLINQPIFENDRGLNLAEIYIDPYFSVHNSLIAPEVLNSLPPKLQQQQFIGVNPPHTITDYISSFIDGEPFLNDIPFQGNTFAILGYPGQGKTSLCKKILCDLILSGNHNDRNIFFIQLRNFSNSIELVNDPIGAIRSYLATREKLKGISHEDVLESILILDGLDELRLKSGMNDSSIDEFVAELSLEAENSNNLMVVLTSRFGYLDISKLLQYKIGFLHIQGFDIEQQKKWLSVFHRYYPETWLTQNKIDKYNSPPSFFISEDGSTSPFWDKNSWNINKVKVLFEQPILLYFITKMDPNEIGGTNRTILYQNLISKIVDKSLTEKKPFLRNISKGDFKKMLYQLAYLIHQSEFEYINKKEIEEHNHEIDFISKLGRNNFLAVSKGIMISFFFDEKKIEKTALDQSTGFGIEFLHKSIHEYLLAERVWELLLSINKNSDNSEILKKTVSIFSGKILPYETLNHLLEIIENSPKEKSESALWSLKMILDDFLNLNFTGIKLSSNNIIDQLLSCFYNYWMTLKFASKTNLYLSKSSKSRLNNNILHLKHLTKTVDLSAQDMTNSNFVDQTITNSLFEKSICNNCNFENSILDNCNFSASNFTNVNLENAILEDVQFNFLGGVVLGPSIFIEGNFSKSMNFSSSDLTKSSFSGGRLENSNFHMADLSNSNLRNASLRGADMSVVKGLTIEKLRKVKSLKGCSGLPAEWMEELSELL